MFDRQQVIEKIQNMSKKQKLLSLGGIALLGVAITTGVILSKGGADTKDDKYITEFSFQEEGKPVTEVKVDKETKRTRLFVGGKEQEILSSYPRSPGSILVLPKVKEKNNTLEGKTTVSDLTWESTLEESAQYINYLEDKGFKKIREVTTAQYIELVYQPPKGYKAEGMSYEDIFGGGSDEKTQEGNENETEEDHDHDHAQEQIEWEELEDITAKPVLKRVIIFNESIMAGDFDAEAPLPELDQYLMYYRAVIDNTTDE